MWRNYLTVGLRALAKNKTTPSSTSSASPSASPPAAHLLYVRYETSYDSWMPRADQAYQFQDFTRRPTMAGRRWPADDQLRLGQGMVKDFPQVEKAVYVARAER